MKNTLCLVFFICPKKKKCKLTSSVFKQDLVVKAQTQLRHARKEHSHFNGAHDLTAEDISIGADL